MFRIVVGVALSMMLCGCGGTKSRTTKEATTKSPVKQSPSSASPSAAGWKCPPADKLIKLVLQENPTAPMTEATEGGEAEVEQIDAESDEPGERYWVTFYDLNGDGALDMTAGSCIHQDCWGLVHIRCGEDLYATIWSGEMQMDVRDGATEIAGVRWRNLQAGAEHETDGCWVTTPMRFDGKTYVEEPGTTNGECQ